MDLSNYLVINSNECNNCGSGVTSENKGNQDPNCVEENNIGDTHIKESDNEVNITPNSCQKQDEEIVETQLEGISPQDQCKHNMTITQFCEKTVSPYDDTNENSHSKEPKSLNVANKASNIPTTGNVNEITPLETSNSSESTYDNGLYKINRDLNVSNEGWEDKTNHEEDKNNSADNIDENSKNFSDIKNVFNNNVGKGNTSLSDEYKEKDAHYVEVDTEIQCGSWNGINRKNVFIDKKIEGAESMGSMNESTKNENIRKCDNKEEPNLETKSENADDVESGNSVLFGEHEREKEEKNGSMDCGTSTKSIINKNDLRTNKLNRHPMATILHTTEEISFTIDSPIQNEIKSYNLENPINQTNVDSVMSKEDSTLQKTIAGEKEPTTREPELINNESCLPNKTDDVLNCSKIEEKPEHLQMTEVEIKEIQTKTHEQSPDIDREINSELENQHISDTNKDLNNLNVNAKAEKMSETEDFKHETLRVIDNLGGETTNNKSHKTEHSMNGELKYNPHENHNQNSQNEANAKNANKSANANKNISDSEVTDIEHQSSLNFVKKTPYSNPTISVITGNFGNAEINEKSQNVKEMELEHQYTEISQKTIELGNSIPIEQITSDSLKELPNIDINIEESSDIEMHQHLNFAQQDNNSDIIEETCVKEIELTHQISNISKETIDLDQINPTEPINIDINIEETTDTEVHQNVRDDTTNIIKETCTKEIADNPGLAKESTNREESELEQQNSQPPQTEMELKHQNFKLFQEKIDTYQINPTKPIKSECLKGLPNIDINIGEAPDTEMHQNIIYDASNIVEKTCTKEIADNHDVIKKSANMGEIEIEHQKSQLPPKPIELYNELERIMSEDLKEDDNIKETPDIKIILKSTDTDEIELENQTTQNLNKMIALNNFNPVESISSEDLKKHPNIDISIQETPNIEMHQSLNSTQQDDNIKNIANKKLSNIDELELDNETSQISGKTTVLDNFTHAMSITSKHLKEQPNMQMTIQETPDIEMHQSLNSTEQDDSINNIEESFSKEIAENRVANKKLSNIDDIELDNETSHISETSMKLDNYTQAKPITSEHLKGQPNMEINIGEMHQSINSPQKDDSIKNIEESCSNVIDDNRVENKKLRNIDDLQLDDETSQISEKTMELDNSTQAKSITTEHLKQQPNMEINIEEMHQSLNSTQQDDSIKNIEESCSKEIADNRVANKKLTNIDDPELDNGTSQISEKTMELDSSTQVKAITSENLKGQPNMEINIEEMHQSLNSTQQDDSIKNIEESCSNEIADNRVENKKLRNIDDLQLDDGTSQISEKTMELDNSTQAKSITTEHLKQQPNVEINIEKMHQSLNSTQQDDSIKNIEENCSKEIADNRVTNKKLTKVDELELDNETSQISEKTMELDNSTQVKPRDYKHLKEQSNIEINSEEMIDTEKHLNLNSTQQDGNTKILNEIAPSQKIIKRTPNIEEIELENQTTDLLQKTIELDNSIPAEPTTSEDLKKLPNIDISIEKTLDTEMHENLNMTRQDSTTNIVGETCIKEIADNEEDFKHLTGMEETELKHQNTQLSQKTDESDPSIPAGSIMSDDLKDLPNINMHIAETEAIEMHQNLNSTQENDNSMVIKEKCTKEIAENHMVVKRLTNIDNPELENENPGILEKTVVLDNSSQAKSVISHLLKEQSNMEINADETPNTEMDQNLKFIDTRIDNNSLPEPITPEDLRALPNTHIKTQDSEEIFRNLNFTLQDHSTEIKEIHGNAINNQNSAGPTETKTALTYDKVRDTVSDILSLESNNKPDEYEKVNPLKNDLLNRCNSSPEANSSSDVREQHYDDNIHNVKDDSLSVGEEQETKYSIGNNPSEAIIGNLNLLTGRSRHGLLERFSDQVFAETHLRSFWNEYQLNNNPHFGVGLNENQLLQNNVEQIEKDFENPNMLLNKDKRQDDSSSDTKSNAENLLNCNAKESSKCTNHVREETLANKNTSDDDSGDMPSNKEIILNQNPVPATNIEETSECTQVCKETLLCDSASYVIEKSGNYVRFKNTNQERIPRYFNGIPLTPSKETLLPKRKVYKEATAFTIPFERPKENLRKKQQPQQFECNLFKNPEDVNYPVEIECLLESESPTKLFDELVQFENDIDAFDMGISQTIDDIIRFKSEEHDNEPSPRRENMETVSNKTDTVLHTIIELTEPESSKEKECGIETEPFHEICVVIENSDCVKMCPVNNLPKDDNEINMFQNDNKNIISMTSVEYLPPINNDDEANIHSKTVIEKINKDIAARKIQEVFKKFMNDRQISMNTLKKKDISPDIVMTKGPDLSEVQQHHVKDDDTHSVGKAATVIQRAFKSYLLHKHENAGKDTCASPKLSNGALRDQSATKSTSNVNAENEVMLMENKSIDGNIILPNITIDALQNSKSIINDTSSDEVTNVKTVSQDIDIPHNANKHADGIQRRFEGPLVNPQPKHVGESVHFMKKNDSNHSKYNSSECNDAAIIIQKAFRAYIQKSYKTPDMSLSKWTYIRAAQIIQNAFRAYMSRTKKDGYLRNDSTCNEINISPVKEQVETNVIETTTLNKSGEKLDHLHKNKQILTRDRAARVIQKRFREYRQMQGNTNNFAVGTYRGCVLNQTENKAAETIQRAFRKYTKNNRKQLYDNCSQSSEISTKTSPGKPIWYVGNEVIDAMTPSETSFEETEAYVELTDNPPYLVGNASRTSSESENAVDTNTMATAQINIYNDNEIQNNLQYSNAIKENISDVSLRDPLMKATAANQVEKEEYLGETPKREKNCREAANLLDPELLLNTSDRDIAIMTILTQQFITSERSHSEKHYERQMASKNYNISNTIDISKEFIKTEINFSNVLQPYEKMMTVKSVSLTAPPNPSNDLEDDDSSETDSGNEADDSLDCKIMKLNEADVSIEKMKQRRDSTSTNKYEYVRYSFEESATVPKIESNLDTDENSIVINKLQNEESRESSSQSDVIIFEDKERDLKDTEEQIVDRPAITKNAMYKTTTDSFYLDDDTTKNIRSKIMAYSLSETDSDVFDKNYTENKCHILDYVNGSTALVDNIDTSTETESTIVSAVTKLQAGARGYLTRKRLGRTSDLKSAQGDESRKASFGNAAISESLEFLLREAAARRIQRGVALRNNSTPDEGSSNEETSSNQNKNMEPTEVQDSIKVEPTDSKIHAVNRRKWMAMRQNSMPVQIDSDVFRVIPKHIRKKIKSADGNKQRRNRKTIYD
ncbi:uncharacterized protein LOC133327493 [Musca vetustissima]|uniref:uncharacterized protein LOC133327493 n=1 Tax=Musca vetustissima TaxID=27455 RepID=UPI002AB6A277|nr:uncharacterized protein LOC133327493 [Musca vetustissima]